MNAFLIFCKRHRAQVREKYPHLENRQVTKILGEWWADLPAHQKTSYTDLARQYKEAFLRANPDFKWYKIPAQPPRPPPARPSNQKVPRCDPLPTDGAITFGKLADEAQMGGLSTLLSTASTSSSSSNTSTLGSFSPVYISTNSTSTTGCLSPPPVRSLPGPVASLSTIGVSNSVTLSSSWSESLRRPGTVSAHSTTTTTTCSSSLRPPTTSSFIETSTTSVTPIPVTVTPPILWESGTSMTPPKPPKKRYLEKNPSANQTPTVSMPIPIPPDHEKKKTSPTEEKFKSSPNWSFDHRRYKNESGGQGPHGRTTPEQERRMTSGPVSTGSPSLTSSHQGSLPISSPPPFSFPAPHIRMAPSHQRNNSFDQSQSVACEEQPLNLTTETTICTSQQQLINNIVERMCNGPNSNVVRNDSREKLNFFRKDNLNNNNNDLEKQPLRKIIDARINGMCDVKLLVSKTINIVIDRALDSDKPGKKEKVLSEGCKSLFAEVSKTWNSNATEANKDQEAEDKREAVSSSNGDTNGIATPPNTRPRKRTKGNGSEENEVTPKKRKDVNSRRSNQGNSRGGVGVTGVRRSRADRKCKGKRYEELISEGVLQAPRRSRTRNSRWEDAESSKIQESEENADDPQQQDVEDDDENDDESTMEEDASNAKASEDESGEAGRCRTEDGRRRGQRQLRRLRPDDFDLEARIEALPSLSLDEFTRRKKEKKRTSSSASSATSAAANNQSSTSVISPHTTQPALGVVSSSIAVQADSTSDTPTTSCGPWATTTTTANSRISGGGGVGGVSSSSNGTGLSDTEAASPTPSSSSSSSSTWSQSSSQVPLYVPGGSLSPGEAGLVTSDGGPLIGSQRRKARKQTITRHDPLHAPLRRDTSVVEPGVLTSMGLAALAEVALSQPSMKI